MPGLSSLQVNIKDQPHNLAWINEAEQALLKDIGGSGRPGPMGIPAYPFDDFDDPEGIDDDPSGYHGGGAEQAAEDANTGDQNKATTGYQEDIGPPLGTQESPMTKAQEEAFFSTDGVRDPDFFDYGIFQNVAGPNWKTPTTGPNAGKKTGDFIEVQPKSVNWNPGSPIAASIANILQGVLPGGTIAGLAGIKLGDAIFGPGMVEVNHDGTPKESSMGEEPFSDDGDDPEEEEEIIEEVEEETPPLGTMEQYFKDREDTTTTAIDETNNIVERLGIQNRTIEPFNEWLAGQSEAMKATDMTTQRNKYRETLRDQTSAAKSYLPLVYPAAKRRTEQKFINNLYRGAERTPATQALFDELGI